MMKSRVAPAIMALVLINCSVAAAQTASPARSDLRPLPLRFEHNRGQAAHPFAFVAHAAGMSLLFATDEVVFAAGDETHGASSTPLFHMQFSGSTARHLEGEKEQGKINYYIGPDPSSWQTGLPAYSMLRYPAVYPGIDLVFHGKKGRLEYDFIVAPLGNPQRIRLNFGRANVAISKRSLVISSDSGNFRFEPPVVYQEDQGAKRLIAGNYVRLKDGTIGFAVGAYDRTRPLVIDPVLIYSSYIGGKAGNVYGVAADSAGNAIIVGETYASDFPTVNAIQTTRRGNSDAFVTKVNAAGDQLIYSTYLGGGATDSAKGVAVDSAGNAYITGTTSSYDFPTSSSAYSRTCPGICNSSFVTKLGPNGAMVFSTYLGGSNAPATAIAVDAQGNSYVTGDIASDDLPLVNAFQSSMPEMLSTSALSAFVQKLDATGSSLVYSTYLGGGSADIGSAIAVDANGSAYVAGKTSSGDQFPLRNPIEIGAGPKAFITKFTPDGHDLVYSTLLGGSVDDEATGIAVSADGTAYVTGNTQSPDFPVLSTAFKTMCDTDDGTQCSSPTAFALALDASGTAVKYSTLLGTGRASGIALDGSGNAYVVGTTASAEFPAVQPVQAAIQNADAFAVKLNPSGTPVYSTFLGGRTTDDSSVSVAVNNSTMFIAGTVSATNNAMASGTDFPLVNPMSISIGCCGINSPFLAEISTAETTPRLSVSPLTGPLVTVRNVSSLPLTFSSITASSGIQMAGDCKTGLAAGQDCIVYFPGTGTLTIASNAAGSPATFNITGGGGSGSYLIITPQYLVFPPTMVGGASKRSVLVRNVGPTTGQVFPNVTGDFAITNNCAGGVPAGSSCTVDVSFSPSAVGGRGGQLSINNQTLYLSGVATAKALWASANAINFGTQDVGAPALLRVVTVQNVSSGVLGIGTVSVSGPFSSTSDCPSQLAVGSACHVSVQFTPTTNAFSSGTLTINQSGTGGAVTVALSGTGHINSDLQFSTYALQFGYTTIGDKSSAQPLTVTNASSHSVNVSSVTTTGDFSQTNNCVGPLVAGGTCTVSVSFLPTATGDRSGVLSVFHDGQGSPQQAQLSGIGQTRVQLTPSPVDFGDQIVSTTSGQHYLSLGNNTAQAITISNISISSSEFKVAQDPCTGTTLPAWFGCAIQLTFTPSAAGLRQATVTVTTTNPVSTQTASVQGRGTDFQFAAAVPGGTAATVSAGQTARFNLQLTGTEGFSDSISLACTSVPAGYTCAVNPNSVTLGTAAQNIVVSVGTPAHVAGLTIPPGGDVPWPIVALFSLFMLAFTFVRRELPRVRPIALVLALAMLGGCGGSKSSPPPGITQNVTVSATSSTGVLHTLILSVTVK